ncbi:hypothetical protein ACWEOH_02400 [Agromyces sp. NPDC004153]
MSITTEPTPVDGFEPGLDDELAEDFEPESLGAQVMHRLIRGASRPAIAEELDLALATVHREVAILTREHNGARGSYAERLALVHWRIDDAIQRAYRMVEEADSVAVLAVLVELARLDLQVLVNVESGRAR